VELCAAQFAFAGIVRKTRLGGKLIAGALTPHAPRIFSKTE
jgi:hypothetical protein